MDEPVDDALHTELAFLRKRVALLERAESARTGVEGMFRAVIDTLPQSIFWKDRHSIYIGCNQQFAHDVGAQSPIDIMGKMTPPCVGPRMLLSIVRMM